MNPRSLRLLVASLAMVCAVTGSPGAQAVAQTTEPDAHSTYTPTGPPPAAGYRPYRGPTRTTTETVIGGVPAYVWRHGCAPTAAGMVIGFWDAHGFPLLIPGDASTQTEAVDQAIATGDGVGTHYSDYSLPLDATPGPILPDLSEAPSGDEHASDCLADFMKTSWSARASYYGWTWFSDIPTGLYRYVAWADDAYHADYTATPTAELWGQFTWADLKSEINAGRPVMFLVDSNGDGTTDHFVAVIGWRDTYGYNEYACLDTWGDAIRWERFRQPQAGSPWGVYGAVTLTITGSAYTLDVATVGPGTVARMPDLAIYTPGTVVTLTATAEPGYRFVSWGGDLAGDVNPTWIRMNANKTVIAAFADDQAPSVQVTAPVGGERWDLGSVQTITWTAGDNVGVDSVDVDCSLTGADGPWLAVAHGLANSGSYEWTLPAQASDSARVRVTAYDPALNTGSAMSDSSFHIVDPAVAVEGDGRAELAVARPQPNPGRGTTLLRFSLPQAGHARLEILDLSGRRLWQQESDLGPGLHAWRWSGRSEQGGRVGSGLYFVRLVTPWGVRTERLVWLR